MTKTIYAVSSGAYSDYGVNAICATQELAEQVRDRINSDSSRWDPAEVEEFVFIDEPQPESWFRYSRHETLGQNGWTVERQWLVHPWTPGYENRAALKRPTVRIDDRPPHVSLTVEGSDKDLVDKAFYDRRAQLVAEKLGMA